jgi:hypothetical protein
VTGADDDTDLGANVGDAPEHDEPTDSSARPRKLDTMPDAAAEMQALIDSLLPRDGRILPPKAPVKTGPQSEGRDFVAYAGAARLAKSETPGAEPLAPVMVRHSLIGKESLRELVIADVAEDDERRRIREGSLRAVESTQVVPARRFPLLWTVGICSLALVLGLGASGLRRPRDVPMGASVKLASAPLPSAPIPSAPPAPATRPPPAPSPTTTTTTTEATAPPTLPPHPPPPAVESVPARPSLLRSASPRSPTPTVRSFSPTQPEAPLLPSKDFTQNPL